MNKQPTPLQIGVSACLLGQSVRYDGSHRYDSHIADTLAEQFELIGICPEVEIGMGVPRPPIQLQLINKQIKLLAVDDPDQDYTETMIEFSKRCLEHYAFSGMVLKDRSPSCGVGNTPIHSSPSTLGHGLFTQTITADQPNMPIISAEQLQQPGAVVLFIEQVKQFSVTQNHR